MQILLSILFVFIIKESLSETIYDVKIDLKKYEKVTVSSSDNHIIFDSSDFKKDEEIYFKITADSFTKDYIEYKFYDEAAPMSNPDFSTFSKATPSKTENEYENGEIKSVTKYFTIKKSERDLGSLEGKYLVIVFECTGNVLIENTKENEGKITMIAIIVSVVVVVIVVVIIILCCCYLKKKAAANGTTTNEVYVGNNNNNQKYNMNMNSGNNANVYSNNNYNNNNYNNNNYDNNNYNNNNYDNNNYNSNNNF